MDKPDGYCSVEPSVDIKYCIRCGKQHKVLYAQVINGLIYLLCLRHFREFRHGLGL